MVKAATTSNVLKVCYYFCHFFDFFEIFRWIIFALKDTIVSADNLMKI